MNATLPFSALRVLFFWMKRWTGYLPRVLPAPFTIARLQDGLPAATAATAARRTDGSTWTAAAHHPAAAAAAAEPTAGFWPGSQVQDAHPAAEGESPGEPRRERDEGSLPGSRQRQQHILRLADVTELLSAACFQIPWYYLPPPMFYIFMCVFFLERDEDRFVESDSQHVAWQRHVSRPRGVVLLLSTHRTTSS